MNQIVINFNECEPAPSLGYKVWWKVLGSMDALKLAGTFFTSPAVFTDNTNPDGTEYEGIIYSACRNDVSGNPANWSTIESSGSESSSGGIPCKQITMSKTVGVPSAHYIDCSGIVRDTLIETGTVICTNGHGFTISGGGITVDSEVEGDC